MCLIIVLLLAAYSYALFMQGNVEMGIFALSGSLVFTVLLIRNIVRRPKQDDATRKDTHDH